MNQVRVADIAEEIEKLNIIRTRLANEFDPLHEPNLYLYILDLVDGKMELVISELLKSVR